MTTYRSEPLLNLKLILIIFVIIAVIVTIIESLLVGIFIGIALTILIEGIKLAIKLTFYRGQYGKVIEIDEDKFRIKHKHDIAEYKIADITKFARYYVRKYGLKVHITVNQKEIKFFTPDAVAIEKELKQLITSKGKSLDEKKTFLPYIGVNYTIQPSSA